jgi:hypothetical protein
MYVVQEIVREHKPVQQVRGERVIHREQMQEHVHYVMQMEFLFMMRLKGKTAAQQHVLQMGVE